MTPRDEDFIETPEEYAGTAEPRLDTQPLSEKSPAELEEEISQIRAEMDSTLSAIERRFSTGDLFDRAVHYLSGGPSDYGKNLARTMRDNPVPTTLFGIGLAWLMFSAAGERAEAEGKWSPRSARTGEGSRRWREMSATFSEKYHQVGEKLHELGDRAREKREQLGQRMQEVGEQTRMKREQMSERMHGLGEQARMKRGRMGERMHGTGEMARSRGEQLGQTAEKAGTSLRYQAERARGGLTYMREEQPFLLAGLGIGIGLLLGAILPVSRREEELAGPAARELGSMAREKADEGMEKARQVVEKTVETAREETERQLH